MSSHGRISPPTGGAGLVMQAMRCLGLAAVRQLRRRRASSRLEWRRSTGNSNHNIAGGGGGGGGGSNNSKRSNVNAAAIGCSFETKREREGEGWRQLRRQGRRQQQSQQQTTTTTTVAVAAAGARDGVETLADDHPEDSEPAPSLRPPVERCQGCGVVLQSARSDAPGFIDPRRLAKMSTKQTPADMAVVKDDTESLADELRDLGLDFMLEEDKGNGEERNLRDSQRHQSPAVMDNVLDDMIAQANSELMGGGGFDIAAGDEEEDTKEDALANQFIFCARCFSLRHYGKAFSSEAEESVPDFDFEKIIGRKLRYSYQHRRAVFLVVVDVTDFDGSFPRAAVDVLADCLDAVEERIDAARSERRRGRYSRGDEDDTSYNFPYAVLILTKVDLLPSQVGFTRVENWARRRWKQLCPSVGLRSVAGISNKNGFGLNDLYHGISKLAGSRGDVWVVGSQNAGKSSLINALSRVQKYKGKDNSDDFFSAPKEGGSGGKKKKASKRRKNVSKSGWAQQNDGEQLTEAPMPGTTLGMIELRDILKSNARLIDTPGLLQNRQLTSRLSIEDVKKTLPSSKLSPRTYRIMEGHSVHIGGLARVDVVRIDGGRSCYLTVWASRLITLHMGKTENADELFRKHCGTGNLTPPSGEGRYLGDKLVPVATGLVVSGNRWDISESDVSIGGVGWVGIGVNGSVELDIYSYQGVRANIRDALIPDMSQAYGRKGFSS